MRLRPIRNVVTTGLGIVMVISPLALWVAWSEKIFYDVLLTFGLAFCVLSLIDNWEAARDGR